MKWLINKEILLMGSVLMFATNLWAVSPEVASDLKGAPKLANLVVEPHYGKAIKKVHRRRKHHKHRKAVIKHIARSMEIQTVAIAKLQYEPVTSELPTLNEEIRPVEFRNGAYYEGASELIFRPASILEVQKDQIQEAGEAI